MIHWQLNGQDIESKPGETILQVAQHKGIEIPTLCHKEKLSHYTSCMMCVVFEQRTNKLIPSCSAIAQGGMNIITENPQIQASRKMALELLLSEHVGDCNAPCQKLCSASMNIPQMLRYIQNQQWFQAIATIKQDIALPSILGRICPAPCEKGCRRGQHDQPVAICLLKKFVADWDLKQSNPYSPTCLSANGHRIAIVGAGPTGLSAAYYLRQLGCVPVIYDEHEQTGGMLRYGILDGRLDSQILDAEINTILKLGIEFHANIKIGSSSFSWTQLETEYDAIVIATGKPIDTDFQTPINSLTFQMGTTKFFAGGGVLHPNKLAVRSLSDGKRIAKSIFYWLQKKLDESQSNQINKIYKNQHNEFFCRITKYEPSEIQQMLLLSQNLDKRAENLKEFVIEKAILEAKRCLHCDCHRVEDCKLKKYSQLYQLPNQIYREKRSHIHLYKDGKYIFEPNKCIRCGICVRICQKNHEQIGLNFRGRGNIMEIAIPSGMTLAQSLGESALECIANCPTGALSIKNY